MSHVNWHLKCISRYEGVFIYINCCRPKPTDRQHESQEAQSLYPSALQLTRDLMLRFVGCAT
jgi:hypothetical protein